MNIKNFKIPQINDNSIISLDMTGMRQRFV